MEDLSSLGNGGGVLEAVKAALKAAPEWLKSQFQWIVVLGILWIGYIETGARSSIKEMQGDIREMQGDIKDMSAAVVQMARKMDVMSNDISHIKETLGKHEGRIEKQSERIDRIKDRQ